MRKFIALALIAFLSRTEQARIKLRKNQARKWVTSDRVFAGQHQNQNDIIIDDKGKNNDIIVAGTNDGVFLDDKNGKDEIIIPTQNQHQTVKTNFVTNTFAPTVLNTRPRVFSTGSTFVTRRTDVFSHPTVFADTKGKGGVTLF